VQNVPAIAEVAHDRGAKVLMDNTWVVVAVPVVRARVDVSIHAATK
jgi:cysteine-S-conjugate beta-lyase